MTKHLRTQLSAVVLAAALAAPAAAQSTQDNTAFGGASGEFLLLGAGARGTALGGGFAALTTDVTAMYYNPAGLAQLARPAVEVGTFDYVAGTSYTWAGMAFPMAGGVRSLGVALGTFGFGDQAIYTIDNPDGNGTTYSVRETFISGTYAQNFSDRFAAGFTLKFISDALGDTKASGIAVDLGTSFHASVGARPIRASFTILNLGSGLEHQGEALDVGVAREPPLGTVDVPQEEQPARLRAQNWGLPVMFRVGVAMDLVSQGNNRVTVLGEFNQPNNTKAGGSLGAEWMGLNLGGSGFSLAARGSWTLTPDNQVDDINFGGIATSESDGSLTSDGLALGGGVEYNRANVRLGFDYAYRNMGTLGNINVFSFRLGW
ncbi:MAG: PorV/PorQ family protein [Gemmatimonadales bacterium]